MGGGDTVTQRGDTDAGECKSLSKASMGHSLGTNKSPRDGRAGSASLLPLFPAPARSSPRSLRRRSQGQHNGPVGQGQAWLSSSPLSTRPFSPPPSPGAPGEEVASRRRRRRRGGNIGLWRKSLTPFPLLSPSLKT